MMRLQRHHPRRLDVGARYTAPMVARKGFLVEDKARCVWTSHLKSGRKKKSCVVEDLAPVNAQIPMRNLAIETIMEWLSAPDCVPGAGVDCR